MRIYTNPLEAFKETERDLFEMGIDTKPHSMQDKIVQDQSEYETKELTAYGFKISDWRFDLEEAMRAVHHIFSWVEVDELESIEAYIVKEFTERFSGFAANPGTSYLERENLWTEFLHDGKFAYTYSERISPQLNKVIEEVSENPDTRQAILTIHSNICPELGHKVRKSQDLLGIGGVYRIPCSMYYQVMARNRRIDLIYTMRSCDLLTHFPVDICLALQLQTYLAEIFEMSVGNFTYFTGSLHAYKKDLSKKGIF